MGKYFSNDSDLSKYNFTEDSVDASRVIPSTDNLTQPLTEKVKNNLSNRGKTPTIAKNEDEYISIVREQTDSITDSIHKYSEETKQEITNNFKKFSPVELFEKMNQMLFIIGELSNKIKSLESKIDLLCDTSPVQPNKSQNSEKFMQESTPNTAIEEKYVKNVQSIPQKTIQAPAPKKTADSIDMMNKTEVKNQLQGIISGKTRLPTDGYIDGGVKLEEVFPNLDDEAYQAAYKTMAEQKEEVKLSNSKPIPGKMRAITGF